FSVVFAAVMFFGQSEGDPISMATRIVLGICIMLGGSALAWISSWLVYGFGELIENTKKIADKK
ncbi:MAG: hypothetical protein RR821_00710, partial [Clostridia bacterium]